MIPWTRKYQPKKISEIEGQYEAMLILKNFVENYKNQKKKAVIIHGPSGNGKTCSAYTLANELNLEIIEVNASDFRNKNMIESVIGNASKQMSLFSKGKIILVDEIDGLSGKEDRGGIQAIVKVIEKSAFPLILTSNNPYEHKFSTLRRRCELIEFSELSNESVVKVLKKVCEKENIKFDETALKSLARRNASDLRGAITDLQTLCHHSKELTIKSLDDLGDRRKTESILEALVKILKTTDPNIAVTALDNVDEDMDKVFLWIDENLPREYTNAADLASAYDKLSKADVYKGRIRRWQHWRFLVYINTLLTAGIAVSKKERNKKFVQYKPTGRILKLWWAKQKSFKKKAIAEKIAHKTHTSKKQALKNTLPYVQVMFKDKQLAKDLTKELDLDKEEVAWLNK